MFIERKVREAVEYLRGKGISEAGKGMLLDAGMGGFSSELSGLTVVPMKGIPYFPQPLGSGEKGKLLCGLLDGSPVTVLQGRGFLHEGYFHRELAFPLRVLAALGVRRMVLVAAVLSLRQEGPSEGIVLIGDHIDLTGGTPLKGLLEEGRHLFPLPLSQVRTETMKRKAFAAAERAGFSLSERVGAFVTGPALPTAAETRMLTTLGADLLTVSLSAEIAMAAFLETEVVTIGLVSGVAGGTARRGDSAWGEAPFAYLKELLRTI